MILCLAAPALVFLGVPQAVMPPTGTEEMRIERALARHARQRYSGQRLAFEEFASNFLESRPPTLPDRVAYRTPEHIAHLRQDLGGVPLLAPGIVLCDSVGQKSCIETVTLESLEEKAGASPDG